ncbi:MAG: hypothetical protein ACYDCK_08100 [Thermoplasmatota archaeon]
MNRMHRWVAVTLALIPTASAAAYAFAPSDVVRAVGGIAFLGCLACGLAFAGIVHWLRARHRVRELGPQAVAKRAELDGPAPVGEVFIEGTIAAPAEELVAPLSGDACLFYEVVTERLGKDSDGDWGWVTVERETRGTTFLLVEGQGTVEIDAPEPHCDLVPPHVFGIVNPDHHGVRDWRAIHSAADADVLRACGGELRYVERRLKRGDRMRIEGTARSRKDGGWSFVPRAGREPPRAGPDDPLADEPLSSRITSPRAAALEGGILVALAGVLFVWTIMSAMNFAAGSAHATASITSLAP